MIRKILWPSLAALLVVLAGSAYVSCLVKAAEAPAAPAQAKAQTEAQASRRAASTPADVILGGDIAPIRSVLDPYPTFDGIAVDPENNRVMMSDENRHSLLIYDRTAGSDSNDITPPARHIIGPETSMGFVAGVTVNPARHEIYTVNNDGGDKVMVFSYDDTGNAKPLRSLWVPHQSWGLSLAPNRDELAISVQELNAVVVYRRDAKGTEKPLRVLRGKNTRMEDPHGIYLDGAGNELFVANHGNWTDYRPHTNWDPLASDAPYQPGKFDLPSITVYPATASGDIEPRRIIQGGGTGLNWPMGLDVDRTHDEIAVANYGDDSILIFRRGDRGDSKPVRRIHGPATRIVGPVGVAMDAKNDEIWVANYGDHTALVFPRTANGNVAPKRIIRNAPSGSATCGFTNASAVAYDSNRGEILVPN